MLKLTIIRLHQVYETWKENGLMALIQQIVPTNKEVVTVEKDITDFIPRPFPDDEFGTKFIEIQKNIGH